MFCCIGQNLVWVTGYVQRECGHKTMLPYDLDSRYTNVA